MVSLSVRMKQYETVSSTVLTPRMPMIIRIDGRAFHTYTRPFKHPTNPWSLKIQDGMSAAAEALLREISGAKFAYLQSDEISVLVTDYDRLDTQPWFGKVAQKITSISASIVTAEFNRRLLQDDPTRSLATFDSRCFTIPQDEVCNYFIWRQRDAEKNSVSQLARKYFSHKQLHGKNGIAMQDMLMLEHGVNWNDCKVWQKRGWCIARRTVAFPLHRLQQNLNQVSPGIQLDPNTEVHRAVIEPDLEIPIFTQDRNYINRFIEPNMPLD